MLKIYHTTAHGRRDVAYAYVCANSKNEVAEILSVPISRLKDHCSVAFGQVREDYKHLKRGEVAYIRHSDLTIEKTGITTLDINRMGAVAYIDAAVRALDNCDMPSREMSSRLGEIRAELMELKADANEVLLSRYGGR